MIVATSLTMGTHRLNHRPISVSWRASNLNSLMRLGSEVFRGYDLTLTDQFKVHLGTEHILHRRYVNRSGTAQADLMLVYDNAGRRAIRPPRVCLEAHGSRTIAERDVPIVLPDGRRIDMRQIITQHGALLYCHLYVYRCDAGYTVSYLDQQVTSFLHRLWQGRSDNSLVRITVPNTHSNMLTTCQLAARIAQQLLPQIEQVIDGPNRRDASIKTSSNQLQSLAYKG